MKTNITFVLDSSGSMSTIKDDTIGGFNQFLEDQRDEEGVATISLYDFDTSVRCRYQARPITNQAKLDDDSYTPGGRTALHDAITMAVDETRSRIASMADPDQPDNVIIVVLTDGKENASETPPERVREVVETQRDAGLEFLFIGANQDAALTAERMGMDTDRSLNMAHDGEGAQDAYASTSERISNARQEGTTGGFEDVDRDRQRRDDE